MQPQLITRMDFNQKINIGIINPSLNTLQKLQKEIDTVEDKEVYTLLDKFAQDLTKKQVLRKTSNQELYGIFDEMAENFIADLNIIVEYFGNPNELYEKYNDVIENINAFIEEARKLYATMEEENQAAFDESVQKAKENLPGLGQAFQ